MEEHQDFSSGGWNSVSHDYRIEQISHHPKRVLLWVIAGDASFPWAILALGIAATVAAVVAAVVLYGCVCLCRNSAVAPEPITKTSDIERENSSTVQKEEDLEAQQHAAPLHISSMEHLEQQQQKKNVGHGQETLQMQQQSPRCLQEQQQQHTLQNVSQQDAPGCSQLLITPAPSHTLQTVATQRLHQQQQQQQQQPGANGMSNTTSWLPVPAASAPAPPPVSLPLAPVSLASAFRAPPPLPPGPIPATALVPKGTVKGGRLPPLLSETAALPSSPAVAPSGMTPMQLAAMQKSKAAADAGMTSKDMLPAGPSQDCTVSASSSGSSSLFKPVSASFSRWATENSPSPGNTAPQTTTADGVASAAAQQLQQRTQAPPAGSQSIFSRLAAALQHQRGSLSTVLLQQQQWQQQPVAAATATETLQRADSFLELLPSVLQQLAPDSDRHDLMHAEALVLLLLSGKSSSPENSMQTPEATAAATAVAAAGGNSTTPLPAKTTAGAAMRATRAAEVDQAFESAVQLHTAAAAGHDPSDVLLRLQEYIANNRDVMQEVFVDFDADGDGRLDPHELSGLVSIIPGLNHRERGLVLAVAAQQQTAAAGGDGCLSLQELMWVTKAFQQHQQRVQTQPAVQAEQPLHYGSAQ